jgi:hypothetical protein
LRSICKMRKLCIYTHILPGKYLLANRPMEKRENPIAAKRLRLAIYIAVASLSMLLSSCIVQPTIKSEEPSQQTIPVTTNITSNQMAVTSLSPYPKGWVPGTEGWIPPLPIGLDVPRSLSQSEWIKVGEIASTDRQVSIQTQNNNITGLIHYWVGYAGGPGVYADTEVDIISGRTIIPSEKHWYFPAILFQFTARTDRNSQLVAVDLESKQIVLSEGRGLEAPRKPLPPK